MATRAQVYGLLVALALGATQLPADDSAKTAADAPLDDELLEFLGSADSDDKDWNEYLKETDIATVAEAGPRPAASEGTKDE